MSLDRADALIEGGPAASAKDGFVGAARGGVTRGSSLCVVVSRLSSPRDQWSPIRAPLSHKKATPFPRAGIPHQSAIHGIRVHVFEFLSFLAPAVNIEVVESGLPESGQIHISTHEGQPQLDGWPGR